MGAVDFERLDDVLGEEFLRGNGKLSDKPPAWRM